MRFDFFSQDRLVAGQHAIITGGSSGLGFALANRLAARGLLLTLIARNEAKLASAVDEIKAAAPGATVGYVAVDVSDQTALITAIEALPHRIDVLINSAGILREGYFENLTESDFRDVMDINFFGTVSTIRAALPCLKESHGRIVNIASLAGLSGVFGYTPYCASKHALVGFTQALRFELEPQGVRVQLVCPGEFDSPMVDAMDENRTPENRAHTLTVPKLGIDEIADSTVDGINRGHETIVPGTTAWILATAQRVVPALGNEIARRRIRAVYRGPAI